MIPVVPTNISAFTNDAGYITSETDSQTLSLAGTDLSISNGNTVDLSTIVGDSVGNFTFANSIIDTDDSSTITITPAAVMSSDLTVENSLTVENDLTVSNVVTASSFVSTGIGDPEFISETDITFSAATRVTVGSSPFKLASFTTTERDLLASENGDIIYNITDNKFQGYENGAWVNLI